MAVDIQRNILQLIERTLNIVNDNVVRKWCCLIQEGWTKILDEEKSGQIYLGSVGTEDLSFK